jgi:hypothetical protein
MFRVGGSPHAWRWLAGSTAAVNVFARIWQHMHEAAALPSDRHPDIPRLLRSFTCAAYLRTTVEPNLVIIILKPGVGYLRFF